MQEYTKNQYLNLFLEILSSLYDFDNEKVTNVIEKTITTYKNKTEPPQELKNLENKWYDSLNNKNPDYTVYNDFYYFIDIFSCFIVYSRNYLKDIKKRKYDNNKSIYNFLYNYKTIIDMGCGLGFTTKILEEIFYEHKIYGNNLENTKQYEFCKEVFKNTDIELISDIEQLSNIDIVFAFEFFEHIDAPIKFCNYLIENINPKVIICANSFNTQAIGHFTKYENNSKNKFFKQSIDQKEISKEFNKNLRTQGYKSLKTTIWNDKPKIWVKNNELL